MPNTLGQYRRRLGYKALWREITMDTSEDSIYDTVGLLFTIAHEMYYRSYTLNEGKVREFDQLLAKTKYKPGMCAGDPRELDIQEDNTPGENSDYNAVACEEATDTALIQSYKRLMRIEKKLLKEGKTL